VFMGMGEPLLNLDRVLEAVEALNDPRRFGLGARHITVSTSGVVPGIRRLTALGPQFTLAIKGMEESESRTMLEMHYRKTLIHEYHYRHCWQPNMVVFWDNRSVQHSALHDYYPQRRLMERVTIAGTRPMAAGKAADPSELRRYLMPPVTAFESSRQKRQHEL